MTRPNRTLAIALVSAAVILLQVAITRILSVVLWYHWAFFAISLAMFGVGVPGVWLSLWRPRAMLYRFLLIAAIAVPASIVIIIQGCRYFDPKQGIVFCLLALLPAVISLGGAVCVLLLGAPGVSVGRMYAYDLLGACAGALVAVPLMWVLATPALAALLGLLPLVAYLLVGGRKKMVAGLLAVGILAVCLAPGPLRLRYNKVYREQGNLTPIYESWTPTARLTIFDSIFWTDAGTGFGWGQGSRAQRRHEIKQYWLEQDGSAGTPITRFKGDRRKLAFLFDDVTSIGYEIFPPDRVAIIGAGGGRDILSAYYSGANEIDAIELNSGIVKALRGPFREFSGGVYDLPGVNAIVDEGRSALTRSSGNYDLLQISMIDSWAATAAGAYSLSENNLYTVESYRLYWSRLSEDGVLATSRWMMGAGFGYELPRLLLLVEEALRQEGVAEPRKHLILVQGDRVGTLLVKRQPVTKEDTRRTSVIAGQRGFAVHYPVIAVGHRKGWVDGILERGPAWYERAGVRVTPPTDDKPFFFQMLSPFRVAHEQTLWHTGLSGQGSDALRSLMIVTAVITLLLFFLPFALRRRLPRAPGFWRGSLFFSAIGLSFMVVEISWLQRFILYVGHPSLATTVALGSVLLGAGIGAMVSVRIGLARLQRFGWVVALGIAALNLLLEPVFESTLGLTWGLRVCLSVLLILPAALMMGLFFPLGMIRFGDDNKAWFWALNGAAGVLASVASLALAMEFGFLRVAFGGATLYFAAWLLLRGKPAIAG